MSPIVINTMIRYTTSLLIVFFCASGLAAQTIRTDVTVIGASAAGISAGIQAARSGVKSLVIEEGKSIAAEFSAGDLISLERIRDHYLYKNEAGGGAKDSVKRQRVRFEEASQLLKSISDTVKNITLMLNTGIREVEKDGKGWEIRLENGRKVKTDVIIDASDKGILTTLLKIDPEKTVIQLNRTNPSALATNKLFRTSVAWGLQQVANKRATYLIPAAALMPSGHENIFLVPKGKNGWQPEAMLAGQAAGASAAFCAFFKTTSKNLDVRVTQGELLAYDSRLIPYRDIDFTDRHAVALQHIGLSGILKAKSVSDGDQEEFVFDTLGTVSSDDLRVPMKEYYSRSQIWFPDHQKDSLNIEDAINLMMFTATRGEELRREIEAGWQTSLKFSSKYDPKRAISRREFAVLADTYLQPFNRRVDFNGNLLN